MQPRGSQICPYHRGASIFDKHAKILKNFEKQCPGQQGIFLGLPRCGPGGAKSVRTAEELQFLKKSIIKKKHQKARITKVRQIPAAKQRRSWRRANLTVLLRNLIFEHQSFTKSSENQRFFETHQTTQPTKIGR